MSKGDMMSRGGGSESEVRMTLGEKGAKFSFFAYAISGQPLSRSFCFDTPITKTSPKYGS